MTGRIVLYNHNRKFGFIDAQTKENKKRALRRIYFNSNGCDKDYQQPKMNDIVYFHPIHLNDGKIKAINVEKI